jgi:hypothetical protein
MGGPKTKKNLPVASTGNLAVNNKVTWNQFLQTNRIIIRCIN